MPRAGCSFLRDATAALRSSSAGEMVKSGVVDKQAGWNRVAFYHIRSNQLVRMSLENSSQCHSKVWCAEHGMILHTMYKCASLWWFTNINIYKVQYPS